MGRSLWLTSVVSMTLGIIGAAALLIFPLEREPFVVLLIPTVGYVGILAAGAWISVQWLKRDAGTREELRDRLRVWSPRQKLTRVAVACGINYVAASSVLALAKTIGPLDRRLLWTDVFLAPGGLALQVYLVFVICYLTRTWLRGRSKQQVSNNGWGTPKGD